MGANNCVNGQDQGSVVFSATDSLKREFVCIVQNLPDDWRDKMKDYSSYYKTDKGNARLTNIRSGRTAPTLTELAQLRLIAGL